MLYQALIKIWQDSATGLPADHPWPLVLIHKGHLRQGFPGGPQCSGRLGAVEMDG